MGGCIESGGAGGGGTAFDGDGSGIALFEGNGGRSTDAGTIGCENGFPGPLGASANEARVAEPGAECILWD